MVITTYIIIKGILITFFGEFIPPQFNKSDDTQRKNKYISACSIRGRYPKFIRPLCNQRLAFSLINLPLFSVPLSKISGYSLVRKGFVF